MENKILYITQPWKLSRKDNTLLFENEKVKKVIPIVGIEQIYALAEITVNTKLLQFLSENKITLHFFNYYWFYSGSYVPKESYVSGNLLIKQVEYFNNHTKRIKIAKAIVKWIWENICFLLLHYQKHWKNVADFIKKIKEKIKQLNRVEDIKQVLFLEWSIWDIFYSSFWKFLPKDFIIKQRVKRPPNNAMNALISFANSVLYTYTLSKIYHTQLNPTISYLHEPFERRFSLALDISEVFKIPLTFWIIFNLVNRGMLKLHKHFEEKLNFAYLNMEGRKIFLKAWNKKIQQTFMHPKLKRKVSYGSYIKLDLYKLIKHLLEEEEFIPFNLERKM